MRPAGTMRGIALCEGNSGFGSLIIGNNIDLFLKPLLPNGKLVHQFFVFNICQRIEGNSCCRVGRHTVYLTIWRYVLRCAVQLSIGDFRYKYLPNGVLFELSIRRRALCVIVLGIGRQ